MTKTLRSTRKAALLAAATPFAMALTALPAFAQTTPEQTKSPAQLEIDQQSAAPTTTQGQSDQGESAQGGDIVVTGTLFRNSNATSLSPLTVLTTETLQRANITTVNDAIRSVSADSAGSTRPGFATVSRPAVRRCRCVVWACRRQWS